MVFKTIFRRKILGRKNFPKGGAIIASNHASYLDPPVVGSAAPQEMYYLARESLFQRFFLGWLYRKVSAIPIRTDAADMKSIKTILSILKQGKKILLFPEGTRTMDGELQKARRGIGYILCKAKVPVIPTYVHGTFEALPRHRHVPHFPKIVVSFGKPMYFDDICSESPSKKDYDLIGKRIMKRIAELKSEVLQMYGN